jgi:hypothetical protein
MKLIFDKDSNGTQELVDALGLIDARTDFSKWKPYIPLSVRRLTAIIGQEVYDKVLDFYQSASVDPDGKLTRLLGMVQQSVALFTWLKIIPTLDAQHGNTGRQKRLGEHEKGLTALQEYKDEANILSQAYESVDALIAYLEQEKFDFWIQSPKRKAVSELLLNSKEAFDFYYVTGSHRLFLTLAPIIREVQQRHIIPIITYGRYEKLVAGQQVAEGFRDAVCRPLALLSMSKAVERLPVEVLPDVWCRCSLQEASVKSSGRKPKRARQWQKAWNKMACGILPRWRTWSRRLTPHRMNRICMYPRSPFNQKA